MIVEVVRIILGFCGMDKFIVDGRGKVIIFNDGVIILKFFDVVYFVVKILVDIVKF